MSPTTRYQHELERDWAYLSVEFETRRGKLVEYRIVLIALHRGEPATVRVYDNVHGQHEMHRHTLSEGKQRGEIVHHGTAREAAAAAERAIREGYEEMIAG